MHTLLDGDTLLSLVLTKIEVLVPDSMSKQIVDDILNAISTGSSADGKIFLKDISEAYDIGSKHSGDSAL